MAEHLLQRFATIGSTSTAGPPPTTATINSRIHHEPFIKYPVYGPGSGPEIFEEGEGFWASGSAPGFFPGQGPPPPPPPPIPYRIPYGKYGKARFKGASVAILTFIGFLFFLSVLQNYIRDYSTTSSPTVSVSTGKHIPTNSVKIFDSKKVIVLSSGATKENQGPQYPFLQKNDGLLSAEDDSYSYKKTSSSGKNRNKNPNQKRQYSSDVASAPPSLFTDVLTVDGF
ncbi:hypothetical protein RP20_CCG001988 [Aedes albopictus]|nr:hypothetical protein RP20_CCG001988 [Aedes albopictus]